MSLSNHHGAQHSPDKKMPLKFVIEGTEYETLDQYKTGRELKEMAGIPLETELYLSISKPYDDELIDNEKQVNLARPETEYFFVKKKLEFFINDKPFTWYKQYIRGAQIRHLGQIPDSSDIFLDLKKGWEDDLILDDEVVDLARPGKERFYSKEVDKKVKLIVNGTPHNWESKKISFKEVVVLAFGQFIDVSTMVYTVAYEDGPKENVEGSMFPGTEVYVKNKMIFHATATDKS